MGKRGRSLDRSNDSFRSSRRKTNEAKDSHFQWRRGVLVDRRYEVVRLLGQGTFAKVLLCDDRKDQQDVAVKVVHSIRRYCESARIEAKMIKNIQRANTRNYQAFPPLLDQFSENGHYCMVFPHYGPSLYALLSGNDHTPYTSEAIRGIAYYVLKAMSFLHSLRIIHTDIKPENILLKDPRMMKYSNGFVSPLSYEIVLIDYGSAQYDNEPKGPTIQTRNYRAPEVMVTEGEWSMPADIWSIGCLFVELLTGNFVFDTDKNIEHVAMIERLTGTLPFSLTRTLSMFDSKGRVRWPDHTSSSAERSRLSGLRSLSEQCSPLFDRISQRNEFLELIEALLNPNPVKRLTAKEALELDFVRVEAWS